MGSLWADVRDHTENIGTALQIAFREIEKANPETLYGIFGNANWTNKDKLPDRKLADLIEHFSTKTLSNAAVASDVFGNAYEYLIKRFADQSNKRPVSTTPPARWSACSSTSSTPPKARASTTQPAAPAAC